MVFRWFWGRSTITIKWFPAPRPLVSMVFWWFWGLSTIDFNGFQWYWTIGTTMRWFQCIVHLYSKFLDSLNCNRLPPRRYWSDLESDHQTTFLRTQRRWESRWKPYFCSKILSRPDTTDLPAGWTIPWSEEWRLRSGAEENHFGTIITQGSSFSLK